MTVTAETWYKLGVYALGDKKLPEAEGAFAAAIAMDPSYADAYYYLGDIAHRKGQVDDARLLYSKALSIEPNHMSAQSRLNGLQDGIPSHQTDAASVGPADNALAYGAGDMRINYSRWRQSPPNQRVTRPLHDFDLPQTEAEQKAWEDSQRWKIEKDHEIKMDALGRIFGPIFLYIFGGVLVFILAVNIYSFFLR